MITWRSHSESSASCGRGCWPCPVVTPSSLLIVLGQFQPGDDVHGLQLLEEQLAGVRDAEGGHVAGRLAVVAPETQVSVCQRGGNTGLHTAPLLPSPRAAITERTCTDGSES